MAFQGQSTVRRPVGLNSPTRPQGARHAPTTTISLPRGSTGAKISNGDDINRGGSQNRSFGWMPKSTSAQGDLEFVSLSKLEDSMQSMQRSVFEHLKPLEGHSSQYTNKARRSSGIMSPGLLENMDGLTFSDKASSSSMVDGETGHLSGINAGTLSATGGTNPTQAGAAKPSISFACLIGMAILAAEDRRLTVSEVYDWMKKMHPYFDSPAAGSGWKNSVRHNLSLNKHFVKQTRDHNGETTGKGSYWTIRPESIPAMEAAIRKQESARHAMEQAGSNGSSDSKHAGVVPHVTKVTLPRRPTTQRPKASQPSKHTKPTSLSTGARSVARGGNSGGSNGPTAHGGKTSAPSALTAPSSKRHRLLCRDSNGMDVDDQHVAAMLCSLTGPSYGAGVNPPWEAPGTTGPVAFPHARGGESSTSGGKSAPALPMTALPPTSRPPQNRHVRRATTALSASASTRTTTVTQAAKPTVRRREGSSGAASSSAGIKASFSPNALRGDGAASGGVQLFTYVPSSGKNRRRDVSSATITAVGRTASTGEERLFTPSAPPVQHAPNHPGEGDDVMLEDAEPAGVADAESATSTPVATTTVPRPAPEEGSSRCLFQFTAPMSVGGGSSKREPWRYTPESSATASGAGETQKSTVVRSGSSAGMTPPKTRRKLAIHAPESNSSDEAAAAALLDLSGLFGSPITPLAAK
eukprot:m.847312 g.847312  ORF g.847312 m.847312 type:complete len:694 (+) comp23483_c0_seq2:301-2382(+)